MMWWRDWGEILLHWFMHLLYSLKAKLWLCHKYWARASSFSESWSGKQIMTLRITLCFPVPHLGAPRLCLFFPHPPATSSYLHAQSIVVPWTAVTGVARTCRGEPSWMTEGTRRLTPSMVGATGEAGSWINYLQVTVVYLTFIWRYLWLYHMLLFVFCFVQWKVLCSKIVKIVGHNCLTRVTRKRFILF